MCYECSLPHMQREKLSISFRGMRRTAQGIELVRYCANSKAQPINKQRSHMHVLKKAARSRKQFTLTGEIRHA